MTGNRDEQNAKRQHRLPAPLLEAMREGLADLHGSTLTAIVREVPEYGASHEGVRISVASAVRDAIAAFVELVDDGVDLEATLTRDPASDAAYALGRGEAQADRSSEALLAAYRVGARTVWRSWSALAVDNEVGAKDVAVFAELIFAHMDRISAAAVAGHADELARTGLARQRALETLSRKLLDSAGEEDLVASASLARWSPPQTLTAVAVPGGRAVSLVKMIDDRTLELPDDVNRGTSQSTSMLLVPDVGGAPSGSSPLVRRAAVSGSLPERRCTAEGNRVPGAVSRSECAE